MGTVPSGAGWGHDPAFTPILVRPGDRLDEWVVDEPLGCDGDATVYRAHHAHDPHGSVVIKVFRRGEGPVRRKVEVLRSIHHPNLATVHLARLDEHPPYVVTERVEGPSLARLLAAGPIEATRARALFRDAAAAVAYLHAHGVSHRDLRPEGFVIEPATGRLRLIDFGPGAEPDPAADVHALGVMLYEMVTGARAFAVAARPLDPGPDAPPRLRRIAVRATDPVRAYPHAVALYRDLVDPEPDAIAVWGWAPLRRVLAPLLTAGRAVDRL